MNKKEVKNNEKPNNNFVPRSGKLPGWAVFLIVFFSFIIMAFYIFLFAFFIYAIVDEASQESNSTKEDAYTENITKNFTVDPNIKGYYDSKNKEYVLEGIVTNNSNKSFDDVEIEYYLYDENGVILSVARGYIEDINPNEKWQFKATSDEDIEKAASYKLVKIIEEQDDYKYNSESDDFYD